MDYFRAEDSQMIRQAELLLYEELFKPLHCPLDMQEQLRAEGIEHYFAAVDQEEVVGIMVLVVDEAVVELHHAAVRGAYRGRGIGKRLWEEVRHYCRKSNISKVELYSRNTALAFWRALGFTEASDDWLEVEMFVKHGIRHKKMEQHIL